MDTWKHGRTGYERHNCRCEICVAANSKHSQASRDHVRHVEAERLAKAPAGPAEREVITALDAAHVAGYLRPVALELARQVDNHKPVTRQLVEVMDRLLGKDAPAAAKPKTEFEIMMEEISKPLPESDEGKRQLAEIEARQ